MTETINVRQLIKTIILIVILLILYFILAGVIAPKEHKSFQNKVTKLENKIVDICKNNNVEGNPHIENYHIDNGLLYDDNKDFIGEYKDINGKIVVDKNCDLTFNLYNKTLKATKTPGSLFLVKERKEVKKCTYNDELEVGTEVTCNDIVFNVIGVNDDSVKLLSAYNLNNNKQDVKDTEITSTNPVVFDEINNRSNTNNTYCDKPLSGCNVYSKIDGVFTNGKLKGTVNEVSSIKYLVDQYAITLGFEDKLISANLITKEDLTNLGCDVKNKTCSDSKYPFIYSSTYWTSSYYGGSSILVYRVQSDGKVNTNNANDNDTTGLRPVITVTKDLLIKKK